jgi:BirA family biotin operon repressor/biotin-[acetyl-CoA-carboxylase] ligase
MHEKIVHFLKSTDGYISGEEISQSLNISRAAIWKHMQELRDQGYDIVAVPHLGYQLMSLPDKLYPHEIKFKLPTKKLGKKVYYFDTVSSTMDEAFRLAMEGSEEGTLVCAETQTKGRGRMGRVWTSPKGKGIYLSLILRPKLSPTDVSQLTLLSAVVVAEVVRSFSGINARIKWPNDILVDNKKLVGILTEMNAEIDRVKFVIVGMGINVNTPLNLMPPQSTSLKAETDKSFSRVDLIKEILKNMEAWYERYQQQGFEPVHKRWKELSSTLGKNIRVNDSNKVTKGKAVDIDSDGGLLIRSESGELIKKITGDVLQ